MISISDGSWSNNSINAATRLRLSNLRVAGCPGASAAASGNRLSISSTTWLGTTRGMAYIVLKCRSYIATQVNFKTIKALTLFLSPQIVGGFTLYAKFATNEV